MNSISSTSQIKAPVITTHYHKVNREPRKSVVNPMTYPRYRIKKRKPNYNKPLKIVSRQICVKVSSATLRIMNSFMDDIFERLASEAGRLTYINEKKTLTEREIETAVKLVFNGHMAKFAVAEGSKAVTKYNSGF